MPAGGDSIADVDVLRTGAGFELRSGNAIPCTALTHVIPLALHLNHRELLIAGCYSCTDDSKGDSPVIGVSAPLATAE